MSWLILLGIFGLVFWLLRGGFKRLHAAKARGDMVSYQAGSAERNWTLALAHPMAYHAMQGGFASELNGADDALAKQLRPMVLHHMGLRTDLSDEQVRQQLPDVLRQRWFMLDLQRLHRNDAPRPAMAFACARVTFFVRCAFLLGWMEEGAQWCILLLNAQRAQECFGSWQDYGQAYATGRAQWVAQGRTDVLGITFTSDDVVQWVTQENHPWHCMAWQQALSPADAETTPTPASLTA